MSRGTSGPPRCGGYAVDGGSGCRHDVVRVLGDVPLCQLHLWKVSKELHVEPIQRAAASVVYYLGDPDTQLVKIGTSVRLATRIIALRKVRPRLLLLATEPGTSALEHDRHKQFAELHVPMANGEREWFLKHHRLMCHIGDVRMKYGILSPDREIHPGLVAPMFEPPTRRIVQDSTASLAGGR